jgi:hypothetical protein
LTSEEDEALAVMIKKKRLSSFVFAVLLIAPMVYTSSMIVLGRKKIFQTLGHNIYKLELRVR